MKKYITFFICLTYLWIHSLKAEDVSENDLSINAVNTLPLELTKSWQIPAIHLNNAWLSSSGSQIKVGVIDTGIFNHSELKGRVLGGWNFITNKAIAANSSSDDNGHGTHVSGIIAANGGIGSVVGVAPLANLIPIKVLDSRGSGTLANLNKGLNFSLGQKARIVNLSLGWDGAGDSTVAAQLKTNVQSTQVPYGQIIVIASGNSSLGNPSWPARYASQVWANGQIMAVGAVDNKNVMPSWSNKAGDAMNFYIVAPGVNIYSTTNKTDQYATLSGTSMATPVVSGAAALLASYWPTLRAEKIVDILLKTTDDLGAPGVDAIYGRGLLNVDRALQPINAIGAPIVITALGSSIPLNANTQSVPLAYSNALARANLNVAALDDYGRDYQYNLSSLYVGRSQPVQLAAAFQGMDQRIKAIEGFDRGIKYRMVEFNPLTDNYHSHLIPNKQNPTLISVAYLKNIDESHQVAFGMRTSTNFFSGFSNTPFEYQTFFSNKIFDNPYLGFNGAPNFVGYGFQFPNNLSIKSGLTFSYESSSTQANLNRDAREGEPVTQMLPKNNAFFVEVSKKWDDTKISLASGFSYEESSLLGGRPGSVLLIDGQSKTQFVNSSFAKKLTNNTWFAASYNIGFTELSDQKNSLINNLKSVRSESWSLGLIKNKNFNDRDSIGFAISQPMIASRGTLDLTIPTGLNEDGTMIFENRMVNMKPSTIERDFEVSYFSPINLNTSLSLSGLIRTNPGNIESAKPDGMFAARLIKSF